MEYALSTKKISLLSYKEILKTQRLLPARQILKDHVDENFKVFISNGIQSVDDMQRALSTPAKINAFAVKTGISAEYLKILKREMGSLVQKPVKLRDFPGIDQHVIDRLAGMNIITTKDYYEFCQAQGNLCSVSNTINVAKDDAYEWLCMCNLCRINGIGAVAAKTFFEAGYRAIEDVANANAENMLDSVTKINNEKQYYSAKLGVKDMQFCIDFARILIQFADN